MSPYRVLVNHPEYNDPVVLSSMLSIDKITKHRNIYITLKTVPTDPNVLMTSKIAAHLQTTKHNSIILDKYRIVRDYAARHYSVGHCAWDELEMIEGSELTQQDCLTLAMHNYCEKSGIEILNTL